VSISFRAAYEFGYRFAISAIRASDETSKSSFAPPIDCADCRPLPVKNFIIEFFK